MRYFDTHAHLDDEAFDADREELLDSIREAGVALIVDPGCTPESSRKAALLSEERDWIYFAAGIHPEELQCDIPEDFEEIARLARHPGCVAIGEIGLDYYWDASHKEQQRDLFRRQIALALELDLPVIVHDREAHGDCLDIVRDFTGLRGVFHCFSGSVEMAEELLRRGWYLGFDGPVTYKNARKALEVLSVCPPERILLETDSPYLSPVPMRGRRNDPGNLSYICARVAEVKGLTPETVAETSLRNGCDLFRIPYCD